MVSGELAEIAERFGTPRRTVLLESSGAAKTAAVPMEVADEPCTVLLSATGLIARTAAPAGGEAGPPGAGAQDAKRLPRGAHDVIASSAPATARGSVGVVTSAGRLIRLSVLELPALPPSSHAPGLAGGAPLAEFVALAPGETAVALAGLSQDAPPLALGTAQGVVKRVVPDYPQARSEFDVIALKEGDKVVGAAQPAEAADLVFVTSDAQLLRFGAQAVRPQGRSAGGMAGIRLSAGAQVVWFGAVDPAAGSAVVVTVAGSAGTLQGTAAGGVKVAPYPDFPPKGRGTGGVRCHRLLKGEDELILAWAGPSPALAATAAGSPVDLPGPFGKRDGSGVGLEQPLAAVGPGMAVRS